jgi:PAS domain-containing protein
MGGGPGGTGDVMSKIPEPLWQTSSAEYAARRTPQRWPASRFLPRMEVLVAVAAGMLVSHCLALDSGLATACALIVLAAALPFLAGLLLKGRLRSAAGRPVSSQAAFELPGDDVEPADDIPAGLLIVSSDLRICYANRTYLDVTLQNPEEVLGWRLEDVLPGEGLEEQAKALLHRSYTATSCCFTSLPGRLPTGRRPVSITMTRIPPVDGEDRILVVVEELLQNFPSRQVPLVEGYIC